MLGGAGIQGDAIPLAGCKGGTLRQSGGIPRKTSRGWFSWRESGLSCSGVQRSDRPCWGIQGGETPLASLAEAEKPMGFLAEAVHCGLPQCETCLINRKPI